MVISMAPHHGGKLGHREHEEKCRKDATGNFVELEAVHAPQIPSLR
jgi:hypothetical protein